ncbi:MAG: hypothetical protein IKZ43_03065 [Acidaminococcaceae bacterium]|nr:hypothetical protein [Acidaminococcaceae bacterium]
MGIKSFELEPTKENLLETLKNDTIGRNQFIYHFVRLCNALDNKCSIAIDARWGNGKTFFVKQTKIVLDTYNPYIKELTDEDKETVKKRFGDFVDQASGDSILKPQVCVYYDAWANDNDSDPILSLTNEIIRSTASEYSFGENFDLKKVLEFAAPIVSFFTGFNGEGLIKLLETKEPLAEIKAQKEIHNKIADFFNSLLPEKGERLIIFVDELDRCKPNYAVKLLERIKHYFSNDRITFVFSVNLEELQHTIKKCYGNDFDAIRYLDRFFDFRIELPPADMKKYYQSIGLKETMNYFELVCQEVWKHFNFSVRETEKYYRIARLTVGNKIDYSENRIYTMDGFAFQFGLVYIVPIMIGLLMCDINLYYEFINGKNCKPMIDILTSEVIRTSAFSRLLSKGEAYYQNTEGKTTVKLEDKLQSVYEAIFKDTNEYFQEEKVVGSLRFSRYTKTQLLDVVSMLSDIAAFES